jgi:hypothetical protein
MFDPDQEPDPFTLARALFDDVNGHDPEITWDDLPELRRLSMIAQGQVIIDVVVTPLIEQRDQARAIAVELEQKLNAPRRRWWKGAA